MSTDPWLAKAMFCAQFCADQIDQIPNHPHCGIVASTDPGVTAIYTTDDDIARVRAHLALAGIETLGEGRATYGNGSIVAVLARSTDVAALQGIVTGKAANSPATGQE